jgi:DNA-binding NtrC family response regulator
MRGISVLIVEREADTRRWLGEELARHGHRVTTASSAEEACEILRHSDVDVILMDPRMPAMSGQTLYHIVITMWPGLRSRFAVMSSESNVSDLEPWLKLYRIPVIKKPVELHELQALLAELTADEPREANGEYR